MKPSMPLRGRASVRLVGLVVRLIAVVAPRGRVMLVVVSSHLLVDFLFKI